VSKQRLDWLPSLIGVTALSLCISLYLVFFHAPTERSMGSVQRIFYFHVPAAWVGFLAFLMACVGGIAYLASRQIHWNMLQLASVEIGVLYSSIALVTGSLWARPIWNTWWTWDPRLTATLVMWLYYVATLMLRNIVDGEERKARFAAILNILGFVNVPIVFLAIRLWRTIHPILFTTEGFVLEHRMLLALLSSLLTFTLLYVCLLALRMQTAQLERDIGELTQTALQDIEQRQGVGK
jgi:heme exporter protein C